jgi:hypothetical protein
MKNLLLATLLCGLGLTSVEVQAQDSRLEQMMTKRVLSQSDVSLNIASLTPGLYKSNKIDTIKQLIEYYERNYGPGYMVLPLKYLIAIKEREFEEVMKPASSVRYISDSDYYKREIIGSLNFFKETCSKMVRPGFYTDDVRQQYIPYLSFLGTLAQELKTTPGLKPAEQFLLRFYAHPMDSVLKQLPTAPFNGTLVQRAWLAEKTKQESPIGFSMGLLTGAWVPTGNLSLLGGHPYLGYVMGGRGNKYSIELDLHFRFLRSKSEYQVIAENNLYNTDYYFGAHIGLDGMYELVRNNKHAFEVLGGAGYDGMDALQSDSKDKNAITKSLSSINANVGLGYRIFLSNRNKVTTSWGVSRLDKRISYLAIQAKYNLLNYKNEGGTSLSGNALTLGIIYGVYTRPANRR